MRVARRLWVRAWNFSTRRSGERRLREEIEQHLLLEAEANLQLGMTPAEARRTAAIKFGPIEAIHERYHAEKGLPAMETILQTLKFALRMLRKSPAFTLIAALTLALGIGATSAVFSLIQGVLLTPPPYPKPQQLMLVPAVRIDGQKTDDGRGWAAQQWLRWKKDATSVEDVAGYSWTFNFLVLNDGSRSMQGMAVTTDYLSLMGLKTYAGRGFTASDFEQGAGKTVVLGYEFWQRTFGGDRQIIGKPARISRWDTPPTVIGIMEPGVRFLPSPGAAKEPNYNVNATVDYWVPRDPDPKYLKDPGWNVVVRLRDGTSVQQAQEELGLLAGQEAREEKTFEGFAPRLQPLTDEMNRDGSRVLMPLLGAAALVLLIACGNVAALLLVRGLERQQEYAVRIAMGMGRVALLRQVLLESLLLAMMGGVLGIAFALGAVKLFKVIAGPAIPRLDAVTTGWTLLGWGLGAAILAAFIAGMIPALRVLRLDPMEILKSAGPKGTVGVGERRLLRSIAMLQTSLTLALLVGAGLLIRTMVKIAEVPSGYSLNRILTMSVTEVQSQSNWGSFHHRALERVAQLPGVEHAAFAWGVPLTGNNWPAPVEIEGQPPALKESDKITIPIRAVTPDYFNLMGMPLTAGRAFRENDDDKAPQVAIVNAAFVDRYFPHSDGIGRKFWPQGRDKPAVEIIGDIANGRTDDLTQKASPEIYVPLWQANAFSKHLVVQTAGDPRVIVAAVERELRSIDPTAAVEHVKTLEQIRDESLASRTFAMRLLTAFSVVGTILTMVGIYGVLSLSVASRRQELAIRSAIGAQQVHLRKLIFGEGFRVIAGGLVVGTVLAVIVSRVLKSFLYEVQPGDPMTLFVVGTLFVGVGFLACWMPAQRAGKIDPLEALRYE